MPITLLKIRSIETKRFFASDISKDHVCDRFKLIYHMFGAAHTNIDKLSKEKQIMHSVGEQGFIVAAIRQGYFTVPTERDHLGTCVFPIKSYKLLYKLETSSL